MFVHSGRLEHPLRPEDYWSDSFFERERDAIFSTEWHFAGFRSEMPDSGDQAGLDLAGTPVLCRNVNGDFRAYRNICAHRHSRIARPGLGHQTRVQCPYHGWEYGDEGQVTKLPDGPSFSGIKA